MQVTLYIPNGPTVSSRQAFGDELLRLAREDSRILALSADLTISVNLVEFMEELPAQFVNFGVAEQNLVSAAAGLALGGMIPFAASFAAFLAVRACEQVRIDCAYSNNNVKLVGTSCGISAGPAGPTHQSIEDIGIFRTMPNMGILTPADAEETRAAVRLMVSTHGPMYLRLGRESWPQLHRADTPAPYRLGGSSCFREGNDAAIFAIGNMVAPALHASEMLESQGIMARVISFHSVKPLDRRAILQAVKETGVLVTVEDHNIIGGIGSAVAEVAAEAGHSFLMKRIGVPDANPPIGDIDDLYPLYAMTAEGITETVKDLLQKRA